MPSLAFLDISLKSEYQSRELILPCCLGLCDAHTQPDPPLDLPRGKVKTKIFFLNLIPQPKSQI